MYVGCDVVVSDIFDFQWVQVVKVGNLIKGQGCIVDELYCCGFWYQNFSYVSFVFWKIKKV